MTPTKLENNPTQSEPSSAISRLTPDAKAFHDEIWHWLWGSDSTGTLGEKKAMLRSKYGDEAERELFNALRADGWHRSSPNAASHPRE